MKLCALATLLVATCNAVSLQSLEAAAQPVPTELVQTTADADCQSESYPPPVYPGHEDDHGCDCCCDCDKDYYGPPVLDKCPGVLQLPTPSKCVLK